MIEELSIVEDVSERVWECALTTHVTDEEYALVDHIHRADEPESGHEAKWVDEAQDGGGDECPDAGRVRVGDDEGERDEQAGPDEGTQFGVEL